MEDKNISTFIPQNLTEEAKSIKINTEKDIARATEMLSQCNLILDSITEEKEKVTKPLNEALKAERARFKPYEIELNEAITVLRSSISEYQTNITRIQALEDARIAKEVSKGKLDLSTAISLSEGRADTTAPITTASGSLTFRTKQQLKINKLSAIPRKYLVPDEALILADLKEGKTVAGCALISVQVPVNSR